MTGQEMPKYLGVKIVHALEMSEAQFTNQVKNEDYPQNKEDRQGCLVVYEDGYKSWSPKDVFEKAYLLVPDLSVGAVGSLLHNHLGGLTAISPEKKRMVGEFGELVAKHEKLEQFISASDVFASLDADMQISLNQQLYAMKMYLSALLARFNKMK